MENHFEKDQPLVLAGTIQFSSALHQCKAHLASRGFVDLTVHQAKPLSSGEVLGCTAPNLNLSSTKSVEGKLREQALVFVADGRFHLEAMMIANPTLAAYRYDPYAKKLTRERYDHLDMRSVRRKVIEAARNAQVWGVIQGTLGMAVKFSVHSHNSSRC